MKRPSMVAAGMLAFTGAYMMSYQASSGRLMGLQK